jgi:peptide/nickel transport system permease protein
MAGYILRRIAFAIPTLIIVSIGIFLMVRLLPGDIIDILFGGDLSAPEEVKEQAREQLGLNGSYAEQYWRWISGIAHGDFGFSLRNSEPVSNIIGDALVVTLELVVLGLLIATLVGVPLGVISAVRRDSAADYTSRIGGLIGLSIPSFWLATLLLLFTSRVLGWVPPLVYISPLDDPIGNLSQFILPAISISVFTMAIVMRMVRNTMLEVLGQDYVRTARAKGVSRRRVVSKHALRNALIPVVTIVGFEIGVLIGGAAIVESIFGLPGVGYVLLQAIFGRDYPVIQAMTLMIAFAFIFANLLVDILYGVLDPRISQR